MTVGSLVHFHREILGWQGVEGFDEARGLQRGRLSSPDRPIPVFSP